MHTGCSEIRRMDRGMVRGQQKCLGSGADLGNVFIKETRSWLMVIQGRLTDEMR